VKALVPNLTLIDVRATASAASSEFSLFFWKAKKFVESLPKPLKENLPKDDAEKLKKTFEALGAVVKLE
jgi:large subunit ribosomal protein L7/L12